MQFPEFGILYIDDEVKSLKYFEAIFADLAPVYVAQSPAEGFKLFCEHHEQIGLVLSDKKMPDESGIELLGRIREVDPRPLRVLVTAFSDLSLAVDAFNDGLLYSYFSKPWDPSDLEHHMVKALRHFCLEREREKILAEKTEVIDQLLMADKVASIGILSTGLNHHVRNALTVFRTFYDMLPLQLEEELGGRPRDESFWTDFYEEVGGQINRITSMLSSLSDGSDLALIPDSEDFCLKGVVESASEMIFGGIDRYSILIKEDEDLPIMKGDPRRISQMVRILLQEAKMAMPESGDIEIELRRREELAGIKLTILDSGELIPEEDLKHLFEPFYVRAQRPEDLGSNFLACYLTAFSHGGTIRAYRSEDGRNAIEVCLPLFPPGKERVEMIRQVRDFSSRQLRDPSNLAQ
ncbi:MAG: response regulator [Verrucomicrobiales bacterium]|nr:response regulator [Verrucomicrobiales bacterium]